MYMYSYAVITTSRPAASVTICLVLHAITYITHTLSPRGLLMPDTTTLRWHIRCPRCWWERTIYAISTHFRDYNNHETAASWSRLSSRSAPLQKWGAQLSLAAMEFLVFCFLPWFSIFPFFQQTFSIELCIAHWLFTGWGGRTYWDRATSMEFNGMGRCWEVGKRDRGGGQACWMGKRQLDAKCPAWDRSRWLCFEWMGCAMNIVDLDCLAVDQLVMLMQ